MKKIIFAFVAFAAISMTSCGNKTTNDSSNDSDSVVMADSLCNSDSASVDTVHADSVVVDSMCAE